MILRSRWRVLDWRYDVALALQHGVHQARMPVHEVFDAFLVFQLFKVRFKNLFRYGTKLFDFVGSGAIDQRNGLGKVVVFPRFTMRGLILELGYGDVAESVDLILDGHSEDFDVSAEEILRFGWWSGVVVDGREMVPILLPYPQLSDSFTDYHCLVHCWELC